MNDLDAKFFALTDSTRRGVLERLRSGPATVGELAEPFPMALPSFLKHIRVLESTGWIRSRKHGRVRVCAIDRDALTVVEGWLAEQRREWVERTDRLESFVTEKENRA